MLAVRALRLVIPVCPIDHERASVGEYEPHRLRRARQAVKQQRASVCVRSQKRIVRGRIIRCRHTEGKRRQPQHPPAVKRPLHRRRGLIRSLHSEQQLARPVLRRLDTELHRFSRWQRLIAARIADQIAPASVRLFQHLASLRAADARRETQPYLAQRRVCRFRLGADNGVDRAFICQQCFQRIAYPIERRRCL